MTLQALRWRPGGPDLRSLVAALVAVVSAAGAAAEGLVAQEPTAAIVGEVRDGVGEAVAGADVRVTSVGTGNETRTTTNQAGRYQVVNLRPGGPYRVVVRSLGYGEAEREEIELAAGEVLRLDFTLTVAPIALDEIVARVLADARFSVLRNAPSLTLERLEVRAHPTIERSFMELTRLSPMAVQTREEGGYSITGQPERQNAVLIDGALFQDVFGASPVGTLGARARAKPIPMEAIEEFQLEVAPFDARSTGFTGGLLNAVTRSGTNEWEGSAFGHFRNEDFFGDLVVEGASLAPERYDRTLWGMTLGGPLKRDVAHLFVAGEFESRTEPPLGFSLGAHEPVVARLAPDSVSRMGRILAEEYGQEAGSPALAGVSLSNTTANLFTRLDLAPDEANSLTLQHNLAYAVRDTAPNRQTFGPYGFSSSGYRIESTSQALSGRWLREFGRGHRNEVTLNVQHTGERSRPASSFPQVDVRMVSEVDDVPMVREARAGASYFAQRDALDQTVVQVADVVTLARDDIITSLGAGLDLFRFDHEFLPGSQGYYRFSSLEDLAANRPGHYEVNAPLPGADGPGTRFSVVQPGVFAQNVHTFQDGLVLRYGLRIEAPTFLKDVAYADAVFEEFDFDRPSHDPNFPRELLLLGGGVGGFSVDALPSGKLLFSPRLGFNFQTDRTYRTQVRGGWGMFTGRIPFVWLSNVYRHNGLGSALLSCTGSNAPPLDPSAAAPRQCADGRGLEEAGERAVVGFHPQYRYPRELKTTVSIDQELPGGVLASTEGIFVQTTGRTRLAELNLFPSDSIADEGYLEVFGPRVRYGRAEPLGYRPVRRVEGFSNVLMMYNDRRSAIAYALVVNLEKRFGDALHLNASYSTAGSDDVQSLLFPDHVMNFASSPIDFTPNAPSPAPSSFDRPWKWTGNARLRLPEEWGGTELTLFYVGQAGMPYTYVYGTDINADGYSGVGVPLDASNDLLYVPDPPGSLSGTLVARSLFSQLVEMEPCLQAAVGDFHRRNTCRAPPTHRLDLRIAQPFNVRGMRVELNADILNVTNLLDRTWGHVWEVPPTVPVLDIVGRQEPVNPTFSYGRAILGYSGRVLRNPDTGELEPRLPYHLVTPASQWQAQIGLRLSF